MICYNFPFFFISSKWWHITTRKMVNFFSWNCSDLREMFNNLLCRLAENTSWRFLVINVLWAECLKVNDIHLLNVKYLKRNFQWYPEKKVFWNSVNVLGNIFQFLNIHCDFDSQIDRSPQRKVRPAPMCPVARYMY